MKQYLGTNRDQQYVNKGIVREAAVAIGQGAVSPLSGNQRERS